jgi:RNA polymerase sigma-70 factor (ECF subfamily)
MNESSAFAEGRVGEIERERVPFESFFQDTHADLFAALCLITRNRHEAEEIMQDAFLKLLERWDRVSGLDDPTGYLYRTAMNALRKRHRRAMLALKRAGHLTPVDSDLELIESREAVVRTLAPLSPSQRAAIVLTNLLGYSSDEAASILGINPGTVRTLASRGRSELRKRAGEQA